MLITEIPFTLSVCSSCCSCGSILPQRLFCTLLTEGRTISNIHDLPQNMRTNTMFQSAVFCIVELMCSIPYYHYAASSSLCTIPLHTATSCLVTFIQCCIVKQCNIFHFHHSVSVENAKQIFPQFFQFHQLDIPVSQNHVFLACSFSTLYLSVDFTQGWFIFHTPGIFTEKHVQVLTQYRPSGTFRLGIPLMDNLKIIKKKLWSKVVKILRRFFEVLWGHIVEVFKKIF